MKNNKYSYLDDNILADRGFHVPTHRIIKIPYIPHPASRKSTRSYGREVYQDGRRIRVSFPASVALHLLAVIGVINLFSDHTKNPEIETEVVTPAVLGYPRSLDERVGLEFPREYLMEVPVYDPNVDIGHGTQSLLAQNNNLIYSAPQSLNDLMAENNPVFIFRRLILEGKNPIELYSHTAKKGDLNKTNYIELFYTFLDAHSSNTQWASIDLLYSLLLQFPRSDDLFSEPHIDSGKLYRRSLFTVYMIGEDGHFRVTYSGLYPKFKGRNELLDEQIAFIKSLLEKTGNKFFPPSIAGLKAPYRIEIDTYIISR